MIQKIVALVCCFPPSTHVFLPVTFIVSSIFDIIFMKFLPFTLVVYPSIAFSETLYSYKYPSVSYFAKLLNVYVFPFHTTVASTVSSTLTNF